MSNELSNNTEMLEKMKQSHEIDIKKMQLKNEISIERTSLMTRLKLKKLQSLKDQLGEKKEIFKIKNLVKKDSLTVKAGNILRFWAIIVTIISTILTIAGGYEDYNKSIFTLIGFIGAIIVIQFTVFIIAAQETRIKTEFNVHSWKCNLLKYSLLTVSIYHNYKFFNCNGKNNSIIIFMLCVALDLICVFLVGLAYDQITLNTFKKKEQKSLLYKLFFNITHKYVDSINKKYEEISVMENKIEVHEVDVKELKELENKDTSSLSLTGKSKNYIGNEEETKKVNLQKGTSQKLNNNCSENEIKIGGFLSNYEKPATSEKSTDGQQIVSQELVMKYIDFMYENAVDCYSLPKKEIKQGTKLTYKNVDLIYAMLERLGIIRQTRINNIPKTEIIIRKNEAIEMVKNS